MNTTIQFLDALKTRNGGASDYAIAKILGVTQHTVSNWRVGKDFLGDSTAIRVATLLEIDPAYVVACAHAERSKKDDERAVWQSIMQRLGGAAAALVLGLGVSGAPAPAQAEETTPGSICIM